MGIVPMAIGIIKKGQKEGIEKGIEKGIDFGRKKEKKHGDSPKP